MDLTCFFPFLLLYVFAFRKTTSVNTRTQILQRWAWGDSAEKRHQARSVTKTRCVNGEWEKRGGMTCWYLNPNTRPVFYLDPLLSQSWEPRGGKNKTIYHVLHGLWPASEHGEWVSSTTCYNTNTSRLLTQAEEKVLSNQKQTRGWATHLTATCAVNTYDYFKRTVLVCYNTGLVLIVTRLSLLSVAITQYSHG